MRILLTGGSGLLGRHAAALMRSRGHAVTTVSRTRKLDGQSLLADLRDAAAVAALPGDVDCVVHLAALLPAPGKTVDNAEWMDHNARSTLNLLELCARHRVPRFVYGSTWSVYGMPAPGAAASEGTPCRPRDGYGLSKLAAELLIPPYEFFHGLQAVVLRFSYVFGDGMRPDTVVEKFLDLAARNAEIPLLNDGKDCTDLVSVHDAAAAVEATLSEGSGAYNIGAGRPTTIRELAETTIRATRSASRIESMPSAAPAKGYFLDIARASAELCWKPRRTLESGLAEMAARSAGRPQ